MKEFYLFLLSFLLVSVSSIEFFYTIPRRQYHCFEENLANQILVTGDISYTQNGPVEFRVITPERREISRKVNNCQNFIQMIENPPRHRFSFSTSTGGNYKICLENKSSVPTEIKVKMALGIEAKDYEEVIKKQNFRPVEVQVN